MDGADKIATLLQNTPLAPGPDGSDNLFLAAGVGYAGIVQSMLQIPNINPNTPSEDGRAPLSLAARQDHQEIVALLLPHSTRDPNVLDTACAQSPLSWAIEKSRIGVVRLLSAGENVDCNSQDIHDQAPLSWAAEIGLPQLLLD